MKYVLHFFLFSFLLPNILTVSAARSDENDGWVVNNSVSLMPDKADFFSAPMEVGVGGGGFGPYPGDGFGRGGGSPLPVITLMLKHDIVKPNLQEGSEDQSSSQEGASKRRKTDGDAFEQGNSGDKLPPDDHADLEKQQQEFESLLAELEKEMAKLVGEVVLVTGLDGTLLPADPEKKKLTKPLRHIFAAFVIKWRARGKLRLIVVTDAVINHYEWQYFADNQLPDPDYLISLGSNTRVAYGRVNVMARPRTRFFSTLMPRFSLFPESLLIRSDGFYFDQYKKYIARLKHQLAKRFASEGVFITDVKASESDPTYTLTVIPEMDLSQKENRDRFRRGTFQLFGIIARIRFDPDVQEVTLSLPMTKGEWMSRLARAMRVDDATIIAVGDTLLDSDLLIPRRSSHFTVHTAVVVGNADRYLKEEVEGCPGVVMSTLNDLLGLAEGFLSGLRKIVQDQAAKAAEA